MNLFGKKCAKLSARITSAFMVAVVMLTLFSGVIAIPVYAAEPKAKPAQVGVFTSVGASTKGTTYYVDAEKGNDANDGKTPKTAWKTFANPNVTEFKPGDHLLLRASSTWNSQMLYPKGNGNATAPIVIDLYEVDKAGNAVYTASRRPIINGNGTEGIGTKKTVVSGAVMIYNQEGFEFRNLEVTNSEDLSNPNAYKLAGATQRCGILAYSTNQNKLYDHIVVKDCYVHDVQTEFFEKANDSSVGGLKAVGGIIILGHIYNPDGVDVCDPDSNHRSKAGFKNVLIENNVVRRVGLEGIRTKSQGHNSSNTFLKSMENVTIRGNYLEDIAGDGIVLTEVYKNGVVENNVSIRACNADYGSKNYAGIWSMFADDALFQYNEVYGIVYGFNDGEAFDIDLSCVNNTYQYNYSHHNSGGFFLFMGDQRDSTVRYNVSANDGFGNAGTCKDKLDNTGKPVFGGYTYKEQSIFHYWNKDGNGNRIPEIYNNTFFIGDGVSTALYGEGNSSNNAGTISHFWNNIIYKEGEGSFKFLTNQPTNGATPTERALGPVSKYFKNNIIWPQSIVSDKCGTTVEELESLGNIFADPKLTIEGNAELLNELESQKSTVFDETAQTVESFTSTERMRERASMFKIAEDSPAIGKGIKVESAPTEDIFGNSIVDRAVDIGAHQISNNKLKTEVKEIKPVAVTTKGGYYPKMPTEVNVVFVDTVGEVQTDREETRPVKWNALTNEQYTAQGTYTIEGTVKDIELKATATVTVTSNAGAGDYTNVLPTVQDAYMQRNSNTKPYGEDAPSLIAEKSATSTHEMKNGWLIKYPQKAALGGKNVLKSKNASSAAYNRRFMIEFDLSTLDKDPSTIRKAGIQLHVSRYDVWNSAAGSGNDAKAKNTKGKIDVYALDPNSDLAKTWSESTATWTTFKEINDKIDLNHTSQSTAGDAMDYKSDYMPVGSTVYVNGDVMVNDDVINVDISDYISKLDKDKLGKVTFVVECAITSNADKDNSGFDAFSKEGAKAMFAEYNAGNLNNDIVVESETSLAPSLLLSDVYEKSISTVEVTTPINTAPTLPDELVVTNSDNSTNKVFVTWDSVPSESYKKEGTFKVKGTSNGTGLPIEATVTVVAKHIVGFEGNEKIDRFAVPFNQLDLPAQIILKIKDYENPETTETVDVVWNYSSIAYDPFTPGNYLMNGVFDLPEGVTNPDNHVLTLNVTTHPAFSIDMISVGRGSTPINIAFTPNVADDWSKAITYSVDEASTIAGVTVENGNLVVPDTVAYGTVIKLKATSEKHTNYYAESNITVAQPLVVSVTTSINELTLKKNSTHTLTATVKIANDPAATLDTGVDWELTGSTLSTIDANGLLSIAADEPANSLVVTAKSKADATKSASVSITLQNPDVIVTDATTPTSINVQIGKSAQLGVVHKMQFAEFAAAYSDMNYTVEGAVSPQTTVDFKNGLAFLKIAADESATTLTVKGISASAPEKTTDFTVNVVTEETAQTVTNTFIVKAPSTAFKLVGTEIKASAFFINAAADAARGAVAYSVSGNTSAVTAIDANGILTIAEDEASTKITVTATAVDDASKTDSVVIAVGTTPVLKTVVVNPANANVYKSKSAEFTATVITEFDPSDSLSKSVTWTISGQTSAETKIAPKADNANVGVLTVGANETAENITVTAVSVVNTDKSSSALAKVLELPVVTKVTINPSSAEVELGESKSFTAEVQVANDPLLTLSKNVVWSVQGASSKATKIVNGVLSVAQDETSTNLTVVATSAADNTVSAMAMIKVIMPAPIPTPTPSPSPTSPPAPAPNPTTKPTPNRTPKPSAKPESASANETAKPEVLFEDKDIGIKLTAQENVIPKGTTVDIKAITPQSDEKTYKEVKDKLGDTVTNFVLFDINLMNKNQNVQPNGKVSIEVDVPENFDVENLSVYRVNNDGSVDKLDHKIVEGKIVIEAEHFSYYVIGENTSTKTENSSSSSTASSSPASSSTSTPDTAPTNQNTGILVWICILLAVAAIVIIVVVIKNKNKQ